VIEVLEGDKRPVAAVADHDEVRDVRRVEVLSDKTISMRMLFDPRAQPRGTHFARAVRTLMSSRPSAQLRTGARTHAA